METIRNWVRVTLDLLYPRHCIGCSQPLDDTVPGFVCGVCDGRVPFVEAPFCYQCGLPFDGAVTDPFVCGYCRELEFYFERTVAACRAEGIARDCLHRFKYKHQHHVGLHLADWMVRGVSRWLAASELDLVVPVPLHPRKQRHRQFNQAEYLARALGRALNLPVLTGNLLRVKDTATQTRLDAEARAGNMRNAFCLRRTTELAGQRVALVDDVFTTGATMNSCARLLTHAGAKRVVAVAFARGI